MNNLQVFNYKSNEVRTVVKDNEFWWVAKDVCEILELGNPSQAISRLDEDEKNTIILNEGIGNPEKSIINEAGLYSLILGSRKSEAKAFKRWITHEVLPSIRKTGAYTSDNPNQIKYIEQLEGVKLIADDLKVNPASKILMYKKVCEANNVNSSFLPAYSDEKATKSLTQLLKEYNVNISTLKFNVLLMNEGILEEATRPSTKNPDKIKRFKRLTDKGLRYGKNILSPNNQRETQPHYYEDTFRELIDLALGSLSA